jgi:hypothetical protein
MKQEKLIAIIFYLTALIGLIYLGAKGCGYLFRGVF